MGDAQMHKKGNIQMTLLLVAAILLVITAWMIFLTSDKNFGNRSKEYSYAISGVDFSEQYVISEANALANEVITGNILPDSLLKERYKEIALKHVLDIEPEGNFFGKVRLGEFTFDKVGDDYVLEIKDVAVQSKSGNNQIKRTFNINMKFSLNGERLT